MPIYTFDSNSSKISELPGARLDSLGILERQHLQASFRNRIEAISPNTLIIAEEFVEWDDSKRRIDLLGIDRDGKLVVIELKRDQTGTHMELQALRYAAMVSTMTFSQLVNIYQRYLEDLGEDKNAEFVLRNFLNWEEEGQEAKFPSDVRIVLAAGDFSKEITTAIMWLNQRDLDIRCVRIKPYKFKESVLLDIEQIIPLSEAQDYQIKVREQSVAQRVAKNNIKSGNKMSYLFKGITYPQQGRLVLAVIKDFCQNHCSHSLEQIQTAFPKKIIGSIEVVSSKEEADRIWQTTGHKRHFLNTEDVIINSQGQELAVSNQWTSDRTNAFIQYVHEKLEYVIDTILPHEE